IAGGCHSLGNPRVGHRSLKNLSMARNILSFLFCIAFGGIVVAQTTTADIAGTVRDSSGGVLPAVKLTLTNQATGQERQVMTDNDGNYLASTLPIGEIHAQSGTSRVQSAVPTGDRFASRETGQSRSRYGSRQRERRSYRPGVWSAVANGKCRSKRGNRQRP